MFWKETLRLRTLPVATKIFLTLFLVLIGFGYLLGFTNIFLTYRLVDGEPGLSLKDVSMTYYGTRDKTSLEKLLGLDARIFFHPSGIDVHAGE